MLRPNSWLPPRLTNSPTCSIHSPLKARPVHRVTRWRSTERTTKEDTWPIQHRWLGYSASRAAPAARGSLLADQQNHVRVPMVIKGGGYLAAKQRLPSSRFTAGKTVPAGTMAVVRSPQALRSPSSKRDSHIDPPASVCAIMRRACPDRGENHGPGKDKEIRA